MRDAQRAFRLTVSERTKGKLREIRTPRDPSELEE
jgi:hypothetical protein